MKFIFCFFVIIIIIIIVNAAIFIFSPKENNMLVLLLCIVIVRFYDSLKRCTFYVDNCGFYLIFFFFLKGALEVLLAIERSVANTKRNTKRN